MHQTTRIRFMLVLTVAAGAVLLSVPSADAQFGARVAEVTGIGGRPVNIAGDVAASVSTGDGVYLAVAGDNTGSILRTQLNATSLNSLIQPSCIRGEPELVELKNVAKQLPEEAGHADPATRWTLRNLGAGNQKVCCRSSADGGVPSISCTAPGIGQVAYPRESLIIEGVNLTHSVWCKFDSLDTEASVVVNVWEEACTQQ